MSGILQEKAYSIALRLVRPSEYLHTRKSEYILSKKVLDSGTNIALLIEEGKQGEKKQDIVQKYSVLSC